MDTTSAKALAALSVATLAGFAPMRVAAEPYDFRGLALGTPLTELRRLRFPEAPSARTICTHDPEGAQLRPTADFVANDEEIRRGVIVCGVFNFARPFGNNATYLPPEWIPARLAAAGLELTPVFWYAPGPVVDATAQMTSPATVQPSPKLYRIVMRSNSAFWDATKEAFTRRYGGSTKLERIPFIGHRGIKLDNEQVRWVNAESTITLTKRADTPNRLQIVYEHATLSAGNGPPGAEPPNEPSPALSPALPPGND